MFTAIFSKINNIEDLKTVCNTICGQIKEAYDARALELTPNSKPVAKTATKKVEVKPTAKAEAKTSAKKETKPTAKRKKTDKEDEVKISLSDKSAIKKLNLTFQPHTEKSWVLFGDTKMINSDDLRNLKGWYNRNFKEVGAGWGFSVKDVPTVANALGLKVELN